MEEASGMGAPFLAEPIAVMVLAAVHLFSGSLRFLDTIPRSRWLSFAGGVAVALVFLEILPELAESQQAVVRTIDPRALLERHVYIVALFGLALFYGMDRIVKNSREQQRSGGAGDQATDGVFWLSMVVVGTKNLTVGYLIAREPRPPESLAIFTLALALEFTVADRGMHADHKAKYDRIGRWVLAGVLLLGWMTGYAGIVPEVGVRCSGRSSRA